MKKIGLYISAFALALGVMTSCEDDIDHYQVSAPAASTLEQSAASVVLDDNNLSETVYTLKFSATDAQLTSDIATSLGAGAYMLEYSLDPSFPSASTKTEVLSVQSGNNEKSYTGSELNILALSMGAKAGEQTKIYFRINHSYNDKAAAMGSMSNVAELTFTPIEVVPALNVVSKDGTEVVAQLTFNKQSNLYEGEYTYKDWNFYFVDAVEGTIYGCDDEWAAAEDCNRSYKIVKDREIGDNYSMWFDPSVRPVTMKVNLETMTWSYERIATEKKDLTGAIALLVGADMGWNDGWVPSEEIPGVEFVKNGDEYTAVFTNVTMTAGSDFGFRATEPASAWIGKGGATVSAPVTDDGGNFAMAETGVYSITLKAVCESDGSITYSVSGELTGKAEKKDLTGAKALLVGADMGWNDGWAPSEELPGVEFVKNGDEYTAVFEGVVMTSGSAFGFRATQPAATWIGKGATVSAPLSDEGNDLTNTETGIFTVTLKAVCTDDGSVTYSISAEKTGVAEKKDLTGVAIIVVGEDMGWHDSWTPEEGIVVTANGDEYTAVFEGVALTGQFGFRATAPASTWIGGTTFATISDNLEIDGNLKAKEAGLYKLTVKAVANIDGSVTYTLEAEKTGNLAAADYTGKTEGIKGSFNEWTAVGAVEPTVDGNKYTWTISGIAMAEGDEFGFTGEAADWLGKGGLTVASECISEEKGNLSVTAAGTYTFVLVATANDNGTTSWSVSASASSK